MLNYRKNVRHKILIPTIASLPILMVYYSTYGNTYIILPHPLPSIIGMQAVDLGRLTAFILVCTLFYLVTSAVEIIVEKHIDKRYLTLFIRRVRVLCIHGYASCFLHQCYQYPSRSVRVGFSGVT